MILIASGCACHLSQKIIRLLMEAILSGEIICNTLTLAKLPPDSKADPRFYNGGHANLALVYLLAYQKTEKQKSTNGAVCQPLFD